MCSAPARRMVLVAIALSVLACSRTDPGISREKAEAILRAFDLSGSAEQYISGSEQGQRKPVAVTDFWDIRDFRRHHRSTQGAIEP